MPKLVDYPRSSLKASLEVGKTVNDLGGTCSIESCAEALGKKIGGSFNAQIAAAVKFGFIVKTSGNLSITNLYKKIELAYDEIEKTFLLREAFFKIPLFEKLYNRFKEGKLPIQMLDKLLIREFEVPRKIAHRVANYFIKSAKECNLLNADLTFIKIEDGNDLNEVDEKNNSEKEASQPFSIEDVKTKSPQMLGQKYYTISISGPGIDIKKEIRENDDLSIISVILENITKNLGKALLNNEKPEAK
jgi:hypothetical protein